MARSSPRIGERHIEILDVVDNEVQYSLTCLECGGFEQVHRGADGIMAMVHCSACGVWIGRRSALRYKAAVKARDAGFPIDLKPYLPTENAEQRRTRFVREIGEARALLDAGTITKKEFENLRLGILAQP